MDSNTKKINKITFKNFSTKSVERSHSFLQSSEVLNLWKRYCSESSVHGIKHIVDEKLHPLERTIWSILVTLAVIGAAYVCILLSEKFFSSSLSTVIDSTIHPVYKISFPGVTICNFKRIDWNLINEAEQKFMPNRTKDEIILFREFLKSMDEIEFGDFVKFSKFENSSLTHLDHINLTDVAYFMRFKCEDLFRDPCYWRSQEFNCCKIFTLQKTPYGLCYSFNSQVSQEKTNETLNGYKWPLRTWKSGYMSGLQMKISFQNRLENDISMYPPGVLIIVHQPKAWPIFKHTIPGGASVKIVLTPILTIVEEDVHKLDLSKRQCLFSSEFKSAMTLPGTEYLYENCEVECRQKYTLKYCNCVLENLFATGKRKVCRASDFLCLSKYNAIFNTEKPDITNSYFRNDKPGMICNCSFTCSVINYQSAIYPNFYFSKNFSSDKIKIDVHFKQDTMIAYKTIVVFGWLDLLVSFGGIVGLFLGSSLLSAVEILYFFTIGLAVSLNEKKLQNQKKNKFKKISKKIPKPVAQKLIY